MVAHADHRRLAVLAMIATTPTITAVPIIAIAARFTWLILLFGPFLARPILRLAVLRLAVSTRAVAARLALFLADNLDSLD